jgi:hypothetical protein
MERQMVRIRKEKQKIQEKYLNQRGKEINQ